MERTLNEQEQAQVQGGCIDPKTSGSGKNVPDHLIDLFLPTDESIFGPLFIH